MICQYDRCVIVETGSVLCDVSTDAEETVFTIIQTLFPVGYALGPRKELELVLSNFSGFNFLSVCCDFQ